MMNKRSSDVAKIVCGGIVGACLTLMVGQTAVSNAAPAAPALQGGPIRQRYQIAAMPGDTQGVAAVFILDHESNKLYQVRTGAIPGDGETIERLIRGN